MADWKHKWKAKGQTFTHLLLSGGKLFVDDQHHGTFLNEYANAIARRHTEYIVETKTPVFRLFLDFDFSPPPDEMIMDAAIKSACNIAAYYFDVTSEAVILKKTTSSTEKVGIHVTWDAIFVDTATANAYRAHLVNRLEDACPDVPWKTIVDAAVFGGTGLRLPWSHKRDAPGVYVPSYTCSIDVFRDIPAIETAADIRAWIRRTSIRAPGASLTSTCIVTSSVPSSPSSASSSSAVHHASVAEYGPALNAFHDTLPQAYRDETHTFTGIHRFGDTCFVVRSSSKKCGNKNYAEHHTSTVYFVILKKGVAYQRCYCRKDEVRETGITCTDYAGPPWPLPQDVIDAFWPPPPKPVLDMLKIMDRTRPVLKRTKKKPNLKNRAETK
jgi:hypothetical protein